jgi:amidase
MVWEVNRGMEISDSEVAEAAAIASKWSECVKDVLTKYDALALPTAQVWPFDSRLDWPPFIGSKEMDTYHRWMEVVVPATLGGLPCVTIPAGFGDSGLPMGIQLIGARGSDAKLLSLAKAYHEVTDWPSKRPPVLISSRS